MGRVIAVIILVAFSFILATPARALEWAPDIHLNTKDVCREFVLYRTIRLIFQVSQRVEHSLLFTHA
ncbi:MAG: hypothetical protein DRI30_04520 [Chloroflexi bacterium]|nr:MAG: hypothetical protein DRI30_04520 [Chloroflexota bacterium]